VHTLARAGEDAPGALAALAEALGAPADGAMAAASVRPDRPTGAVTSETLAAAVGATLPEGAIVVDEATPPVSWSRLQRPAHRATTG